MYALPTLSGREVVRAFASDGWEMVRQRGSHMILVKDGEMATLSVPDHKEVAKGTLRSLIPSRGLSFDPPTVPGTQDATVRTAGDNLPGLPL